MCKMKSLKDAMYGLAVGDALGSPVQFQKRDSYPIVSEMMAVNLGGDTDSISAVTGGLAGIMYGYDQIPESWIKSLRKKKMIDQYLFQ